MILSCEGEEACGKTTLAYTAPLKIVGFQFDLGAERALLGSKHDEYFKDVKINFVPYDKARKEFKECWTEHDIAVFELPMPIQIDSTQVRGVREVWDYFLGIIGEAIRDPLVRTLVVDTMTLARRAKIDAYLQALQEKQPDKNRVQLLQIEYGTPNTAIRDLYNACNSVRKNLVALHHLHDEYGEARNNKGDLESVKTGRRTLEGLDQTYRFVDMAIRMEKEKGKLSARIVKCGYKLELEGVVMANPTWDGLVSMVEATLGGRIQFERRTEGA